MVGRHPQVPESAAVIGQKMLDDRPVTSSIALINRLAAAPAISLRKTYDAVLKVAAPETPRITQARKYAIGPVALANRTKPAAAIRVPAAITRRAPYITNALPSSAAAMPVTTSIVVDPANTVGRLRDRSLANLSPITAGRLIVPQP